MQKCQNEVLNSRATYVLRQEVVESVLTARPILNAVHGASDANPIEKCGTCSCASCLVSLDLHQAQ